MKKKLFLVLGRTGSGKDTCVDYVCEKLNMKKLISYSTRPKRKDEANTHIFIQPEEVEQYKADIVAYTKIGEYEYFATENLLEKNDFYIIDPKGLFCLLKNRELLKKYNFKICYFFISGDKQTERAKQRGDETKTFKTRCKDEDAMFSKFENLVLKNILPVYVIDSGKDNNKNVFLSWVNHERKH